MKTTIPDLQKFESTYALIVRSEEKERTASEIIAYALLIVSALFAFWQITQQPFTVPTNLVRSISAQTAQLQRPVA